ncbi:MAG: acyl-CoA dehydrogenase family protein, partial [Anaerolineae bacterium]
MNLTFTPQEETWRAAVRKFAAAEVAPFAAEWDRAEHLPRRHAQKLADFGLF